MRTQVQTILASQQRRTLHGWLHVMAAVLVITAAFAYAHAFDPSRYRGALSTLLTLAADSVPPDFSRWQNWGKPLLETLSMSICGTTLAAILSLPLGAISARNSGLPRLGTAIRMGLNGVRSIPALVWGVMFVAAVGFGPLPGIFALACHSTGMLGKFYAEILEHVDPVPGDALKSQGTSYLGVLRFSILPQILPRLVDVTLYRWEHNVRAATVLGVVGAGGLGLEIITAFHLFEYREACALILVLLVLVSGLNVLGGTIRSRLLGGSLVPRCDELDTSHRRQAQGRPRAYARKSLRGD